MAVTQIDIETAKRRAVIAGTGRAVPGGLLTNADLEKMVDTTDEWITTRTGIKTRHIVTNGETTASLAMAAARQALARAGMSGADLDLIICATITPEMVFPATACFIQSGLGNQSCCAFDVSAACSGFTYALATAASFISTGQYNNALVMGAETLSTITNYQDRGSCILFGDGAGAVVLKAEENSRRGIIYSNLHADGSGWETLSCRAFGSRNPAARGIQDPGAIFMNIKGRETYQTAVRRIVEMVEECYAKLGIGKDDIKLIVPHQMNARIIESVIKRLEIPQSKMFINIDRYGNTSSASIGIALDEVLEKGCAGPGDLIMLVAFGAGLTWAINVIRL